VANLAGLALLVAVFAPRGDGSFWPRSPQPGPPMTADGGHVSLVGWSQSGSLSSLAIDGSRFVSHRGRVPQAQSRASEGDASGARLVQARKRLIVDRGAQSRAVVLSRLTHRLDRRSIVNALNELWVRDFTAGGTIVYRSPTQRRPRNTSSQTHGSGAQTDVWPPPRHARRFLRDGSRWPAGGT
jgi:hypothetical protein